MLHNLTDKKSNRYVFREHIILLIEGRFFMLALIGFLIWFWSLFLKDLSTFIDEALLAPLIATILAAIVFHEFWYRCFGRLIITENEIIWKCPFMRTRRIRKNEIKYSGFDYRFSSGNLRNITTMDMAYFSKQPYPKENIGKSYRLRNSDNFIKFHASEKLCFCLREWLPEPHNRIFANAYNSFLKKERKKQRHMQKH